MEQHVGGSTPTEPDPGAVPHRPVICLGDFLPEDPAVATRLDHVVDGTRPMPRTLLPVHALDRLAVAALVGGTPVAAAVVPLLATPAQDRPAEPTAPPAVGAGVHGAGRTPRRRRPPSTVATAVGGVLAAAAALAVLVSAGLAPPSAGSVLADGGPTTVLAPDVAAPTSAFPSAEASPDRSGPSPVAARSSTTRPVNGPSRTTTPPVTADPTPTATTNPAAVVPETTAPGTSAPGTTTAEQPQEEAPATTDVPEPTSTETPTPEPTPTATTSEGTTTEETSGPAEGTEVDPPPTSVTDEWLVLALGGLGLGLGGVGRHRVVRGRHRRGRARVPGHSSRMP